MLLPDGGPVGLQRGYGLVWALLLALGLGVLGLQTASADPLAVAVADESLATLLFFSLCELGLARAGSSGTLGALGRLASLATLTATLGLLQSLGKYLRLTATSQQDQHLQSDEQISKTVASLSTQNPQVSAGHGFASEWSDRREKFRFAPPEKVE